jgi:hypothetical protein
MNSIASVVEQDKRYTPRRAVFYTLGGPEPELCSLLLDKGLDYIILIVGATGSVSSKGESSFIPLIETAISKRIPVYMLRDVYSSRDRLANGTYDGFRKDLSSLYSGEAKAIRTGAIQLEKPDSFMLNGVVITLDGIYSKKPSYDEGIEEVTRIYNSPEFNAKLKEIRDKQQKKNDN